MKPIHAIFCKSLIGKIWRDENKLEWKVIEILMIHGDDDGSVFIKAIVERHGKTFGITLSMFDDVLE